MAEDIFDLAVSGYEKDFIKNALKLEGEVASEILNFLEKTPWLGSLIKLGEIGKGVMDLHFIYKIAKFLQQSEDISDEEKERFLEKLDPKQRKKMYEYLVHFLYEAEIAEKAEIMGYFYRERIMNYIDDSIFLRLCSVIKRLFVDDLACLESYIESSEYEGCVTDNLYVSGILEQYSSNDYEKVPGKSYYSMSIGLKYRLNETGKILYKILCKYKGH